MDEFLLIFIGVYLAAIYFLIAIFKTKSRMKAFFMGLYLIFVTLLTATIFITMIGIGNAWSGGSRPDWTWYVAPFFCSSFFVFVVLMCRKFSNTKDDQ